MKKVFCAAAVAAVVAVPAALFGASAGSCEAKASSIKVGGSKATKLVNEYDPEWKETGDNGVYLYSVTLSKGNAYTVWIEGGNVENIELDVYARSETDAELDRDVYAPVAGFVTEEYAGVKAAYMMADDWDSDDPSSWKYYIRLDGDGPGLATTVHIEQGTHPFVELGTAENPQPLTVTDKSQQLSKTLIEGEYYMTARLTAGRKYLFRTVGGTAAAPLTLEVDGPDFNLYDNSDYAADENNDAFVVEVAETGAYSLVVSGSASFALAYQSVPARAIAAHPAKDLAIGGSATFVPGRRVATNSYFDEIIDEQLFRVTLDKGDRIVFETTGADRAIEMVAYDAKGNVLGTNAGAGNGANDVCLGVEATAKGIYYVGVCDPALDIPDTPVGASVTLAATRATSAKGDPDEYDDKDDVAAGASGLSPLPEGAPKKCVHGPHRLSRSDWADVFVIGGRKGITYNISAEWAEAATSDLNLAVTVFTLSGTKEMVVARATVAPGDGTVSFEAGANASYYVRFSVAEGNALEYPPYNVVATASSSAGGVYSLMVVTKGANGTWSLGKENVKYPGGASVLVVGTQTVKFYQVKGFSLPATQTVTPKTGEVEKTVTGIYSDTFDRKDDAPAGAAKLSISAKTATAARTLFVEDPADWFAFSAKEGVYYNFSFADVEGDAEMTVYRKGAEATPLAGPAESVMAFAPGKGDYLVKVAHGGSPADSSYVLSYDSANVGAIKFQKTAVSAKKSAGSVSLPIARTAKEGKVRVRYGTVAGTAKPGVDYVAQTGELVWEANDSKAKTLVITLIPDLEQVAVSRQFKVRLEPVEEEPAAGEYRAAISTPEAVVTVTEAAARAAKVPVAATVKTETVPLETGTFTGVLKEDGAALTNGCPALASVVLSVKNAATKALSANVTVAGKTYAFAADTWSADSDDEYARAELVQVQKVGAQPYTNVLAVAVRRGETAAADAYLEALAEATLTMNVPDANNKGVQEDIAYIGELYRDNSKIQGYLTAVLDAVGYYTVALAPAGAPWAYDAPAGNGYLTVTIDNKGKARIAGQLADGTTKPTYASFAAMMPDGTVKIPVFVSKMPTCFGGTLVLKKGEQDRYVVDSSSLLLWNNDNAALTYWGEEGWRLELEPVGGYFNTLVNLQAYYLTCTFAVSTADVFDLPEELLLAGYSYSGDAQPNETEVLVKGNTLSTAKRTLVKSGRLNDLAASVNACNVQVRLARPTGLVSGTLSAWTEKADGTAQKEVTGLRHQGVLVLSRDDAASLDPAIMSAGFFTLKTTLKNGTRSRSWTMSLPFNVMAFDQGEPDWYADDWGERPEE